MNKSLITLLTILTATIIIPIAIARTWKHGVEEQNFSTNGRNNGSDEYNAIWNQFLETIENLDQPFLEAREQVLITLSKAENAGSVTTHVVNVINTGYNETAWVVIETYFKLNPNDTLEYTAGLIDSTWTRTNQLLIQYSTEITNIVRDEALEILPEIENIHSKIGKTIQLAVSPLLELIKPYLS